MSKLRKPILAMLFMFAGIGVSALSAYSQYIEAIIKIDPSAASARVTGRWAAAATRRRNLSFPMSVIGAPDLGGRISNVSLIDPAGRPVSFRAFNSAEYVADADFEGFSYDVDLKPPADPRSAAHVSWIAGSEGVLFPDDLLPRSGEKDSKKALLTLISADGWTLFTTERSRIGDAYEIENIERSVFIIGKEIRQIAASKLKKGPSVIISGRWLFDDANATAMTEEIYREYARIFGGVPAGGPLVALVPMPQAGTPKGTWEAETRGSTVIIASSDMAFKTQSLQRLHEQLRHEIFHLWMPNGVNLTGRYDWFYEGFALYQSLRTGVQLNRIRFGDFLDTLSRAHSIDRSQTRRRSLIEASRERWAGADTQLYARGMVVAFLSDLALLQASNGKASIESLLKRVYARHRFPAAAVDANEAVLKLFDADPKLAVLAADHIEGAKAIEWAGIIEAAGLENEPGTSRTSLRIKAKLTGRQKTLLDKLGYNNWRKLTRK